MHLDTLIQHRHGTIIDVRSEAEFQLAHSEGAICIPLDEIEFRLHELRAMAQPLILCCASGNRSGIAERKLKALGFSCINAGSWMDLAHAQHQLVI